ncbi:YdgA family protein [Candidimonas nitroreducens]|uniref:GTP-binding protein n=1 Tax=Candidimonas nitroreducens TaxID=683354 RepID=A0A225M7X2_9BURK|nr:YdgA family protein [Candidimonas nitroreducens]OWT57434.1 hypothetical protein CEY11_16075 [Candidimonas nitroreducens]
MKKSAVVLGVVVAVGVVYTAGSWYVGKRAQQVVERAVQQANERAAGVLGPGAANGTLKVVVNDYQRHVFSSDVLLSIEFKGPDGKAADFTLHDHLDHGPFPWSALRAGRYAPLLAYSQSQLIPTAATQPWFDALKGESPVTAQTRVQFSGLIQSRWNFKPLQYKNADGDVQFGGGFMSVDADGDGKNGKFSGKFPSLTLVYPDTGERIAVQGVELHSTTSSPAADASQIKSEGQLQSLDLTPQQGAAAIHVQKLGFHFDSNQKGSLLDATLRYDLGRIGVGDADLGSVTIGSGATHLDTKALAALASEYDALRAKHGDDLGSSMSDAEADALRQKALGLLDSQPMLALDPMVWKNDKGQSSFALKLNLAAPQGDASAAGMAGFQSLLPQVLQQIDFNLSISRPMFIEAAAQLAKSSGQPATPLLGTMLFDQYAGRLEAQGLVQKQGDTVTAAIRYSKGRVEVNGKDMSVDDFVQKALASAM